MTSFANLSLEDQAALQAAAEWWERLRVEPHRELSPEFLEWASHQQNAKAMDAVRMSMEILGALGATSPIINLRYSALARLRNADMYRRVAVKAFAAAAVLLMLLGAGGGGYVWYHASSSEVYQTQIGERRLIQLADGSHVLLDSNSAVRANYSRVARAIILDKGQAHFEVAHNTSRPFSVTAGKVVIVAVGTAFDVDTLNNKVVMTLIQGRVDVRSGNENGEAGQSAVRLIAGQRLIAVGDSPPVVQQADLASAVAWQSGHLVFRGESLGNAVEKVNRYTKTPIVVTPDAALIPVSGVFNAGDAASFVSAITGYFPVEATTDSENRTKLKKRM